MIKKLFFGFLIVLCVGNIYSRFNSGEQTDVSSELDMSAAEVVDYSSYFATERPLSLNCWLEDDVLGRPCLATALKNTTGQAVVALRMVVVPYDAYGEEISQASFWDTLMDSGRSFAYEQEPIAPGKQVELSITLSDFRSMNNCRFYLYSILFEDGTEWGYHDIPQDKIPNYVPYIVAKYK